MRNLVTIGIPVYNAEDYVEDMILSALGQTYPYIEILIVDDCGNDQSLEIILRIKNLHPRGECIRIIRNNHNLGVGASRNKIIDEAQGKYLYFLDSDDQIEDYTIQLLVNTLEAHSAQIVYASYEIINLINDTTRELYQKPSIFFSVEDSLAAYAYSHTNVFQITVCNSLIDLLFLKQTGIRFIDSFFWEDMAFTYELVTMVKRAVLLPDITYHYYRRTGSLSHYQDRDKLEKNEIEKNIQTIDYLKEKSRVLIDKHYLPYLCKNLEMNSFYIVCHILKYTRRIEPSFTNREIRAILHHPFSFWEIIKFRHLMIQNLFLWLLGAMPFVAAIPSIWLLGKIKKIL